MRDPISNLITQIKNGTMAKKEAIVIPQSNFTFEVVEALARKGYVNSGVKKGKKIQKLIEVGLVYDAKGNARVTDVKRLSKPSKRIYKGYKDIRPVKQGFGSAFISTPKGILSDDEARKEKVGGELLFTIW